MKSAKELIKIRIKKLVDALRSNASIPDASYLEGIPPIDLILLGRSKPKLAPLLDLCILLAGNGLSVETMKLSAVLDNDQELIEGLMMTEEDVNHYRQMWKDSGRLPAQKAKAEA